MISDIPQSESDEPIDPDNFRSYKPGVVYRILNHDERFMRSKKSSDVEIGRKYLSDAESLKARLDYDGIAALVSSLANIELPFFMDLVEFLREKEQWGQLRIVSAAVIKRFPDNQRCHFLEINACRMLGGWDDAHALAQAAESRFPGEIWPVLEQGWIAISRSDNAGAADIAARLKERFSGHLAEIGFAIVHLRTSGQSEEALRVCFEGMAKFPLDQTFYRESALIFRSLNRLDEACIIAFDAAKLFPDAPWIAKETTALQAHPQIPADMFPLSQEKIDHGHERHPEIDAIYGRQLNLLLQTHKFDQADIILENCKTRFDKKADLCLAWCDAAILTQQHEEARRRLASFRSWHPHRLEGLIRLSKVLASLGRALEADEVGLEAVTRFPENVDAQDCFARVALLNGNITLATERWRKAIGQFPENPLLKGGLYDALLAAFGESTAPDPGTGRTENVSVSSQESITRLMLEFQSLGGPTHGCEFGNVQRFFGAEPLHLMRWSATKPKSLITGLEDGFKGFWDLEKTRISLGGVPARPEEREYRLYYPNYDIHIHTFIYISEVSQEEFIKRFIGRQKLLARKFFEDISNNEHILIYKEDLLDIRDSEIIELDDCLRKLGGTCPLLFVRHSDADHPEGSVGWLRPGLMVGYLDSFIIAWNGEEQPIRYEGWLKVCKAAHALARRG